MYEILFSHPKVEAITGWDFADGAWLNAPSGLLRADNSPKPSYRELQRLIHEEWTSQGELHTDENGVAELAGFRETYSLHTDRAQARGAADGAADYTTAADSAAGLPYMRRRVGI